MNIVVGSDHAGFELKEHIKKMLKDKGMKVDDQGTYSEESVDYPDYAKKVSEVVLRGEAVGILICGTGIGISMAANRHPGIRAALCENEFTARMARAHNDANILCMGGRVVGTALAESIVNTFLSTSFEGGRHARRVDKIER
ncbi:MAG: ribose 5-phosphate isomerase B [Tissierellia bacterium]|nr:ribose 5-phosphate isomerase B [Bacillota bacterium]NLL23001.1 ribose 5-phosphate isomerase B [Tissierellia bacterium]